MSAEGLKPALLPGLGLTVLCGPAAATTHISAALIEQWGAAGERIGLVDVRGTLPRILNYATNQLGWYPETVWPLKDRLELASMNGATLVALGHLRWRALRPVIGLVLRGVPVITTLAAPSARRAAAELRQWWTRPYPPLHRRTMRHPRASLPPIPMRVVAVTADGTIGAIMQLGGQAYRPAER